MSLILDHLVILPIVVPLVTALLLLLPPFNRSLHQQRRITLSLLFFIVTVALLLLQESRHAVLIYMVGDWPLPYGIQLLADRTSAVMVLLASGLTGVAALYGSGGDDRDGSFFYPLLLLQLTGVNGAFLTGDLFNLFVFFEVMLIASYALLVHGGGVERTRAAIHYVVLNLVGSALFLVALGILYASYGTLNMADMALRTPTLDDAQGALAAAGGLLLLVVFGLKAAVAPLQFWVAPAYASAAASCAALFAILSKVGFYSMLRVHLQLFGDAAGDLAGLIEPWLAPLAIVTVAWGTVASLASKGLRALVANLVIVSMGLLMLALSLNAASLTAAALFYAIHSTLATALLFLLADMIARQRGDAGDRFIRARPVAASRALGTLFLVAAVTVAGLPPLSGSISKLFLMQAAGGVLQVGVLWSVLLLSSVLLIVALARAGVTLFWHVQGEPDASVPPLRAQWIAVGLLAAASPLMVVGAAPLHDFLVAAADQLYGLRTATVGELP